MTDDELMEYADSRMLKYPGVLHSTDKFESEESSDWDKALALAELIEERGYPAPKVDRHALATHIMNTWKANREAEKGNKEKGAFE